MPQVPRYDGTLVNIRHSAGTKVPYFERWQDNVLPPPEGAAWPPALEKQVRAYVARTSWFADADAEALRGESGRISKFQSLNSEDAVTWSWFGTLALGEPAIRRKAVQWLYDSLGLPLAASDDIAIDQWMRIAHPNALGSPNGPELDVRIVDASALIYVEAKWNASLGTGKGKIDGDPDDQIVLRRDSMRKDPALERDQRTFVVLGVSNDMPDLDVYEEHDDPSRSVTVAWTTWANLADCDVHPRADEFRQYLAWKRQLAQSA